MTLLALTAVICFGFAVYNLTCAFADIPTKRTSRMMLLARKQQGVKAEQGGDHQGPVAERGEGQHGDGARGQGEQACQKFRFHGGSGLELG